MKIMRIVLGSVLAGLILLTSCGNDRTTTNPPAQISIAINPSSVTMDQGAKQQFSATVSGTSNTAVLWSISGGGVGTIDGNGVFTAPTVAGTFWVVATSAADPSKTAFVSVSVRPVTIVISPGDFELEPGGAQRFTAAVTGTVNPSVTWAVQEGPSGGTIGPDGMYTASASAGVVHIVATAVGGVSATVAVRVAPLAVVISPRGMGLLPGNTLVFAASVDGCMDDRVTWAVAEGNIGGTITADGKYTAPVQLGQYHVVATSVAHPSVAGTVSVVVTDAGFTATGDMTVVRFDHTATRLPNGEVLVVGGGSSSPLEYAETASAELYDPAKGTFTPTGKMTTARRWHTASLLNSKVLIVGGGGDGGWDYFPVDSAELYDSATGQFTPAGKMQTARLSHTATVLNNGKVLIAGGYKPEEVLATAELYDPTANAFTATGSLNEPRSSHTATLLPDGRVLVSGGWGYDGVCTSAEVYDPATGGFTSVGAFPRVSHTATLLNDHRLLIAGGESWRWPQEETTYYDDVQFFDPATGQFSLAAKMSGYRFLHTATKLLNGQVLLVGGLSNGGETSSAELFDPSSPKVLITGSMAKPRSGHTATLLLDGRVLVTGGSGEKSAELYTPKP